MSLKMTLCPHFLEMFLFLTEIADLAAVIGTLRPETGVLSTGIYFDVFLYVFLILSNGFYGIFP
jgi:hypothetical protein